MPQLKSLVGKELGTSEWFQIDQERINQFADVTIDHQYIHVDKGRAKAETDFGDTIAHGLLTLSLAVPLLVPFLEEYTANRTVINYGSNKLRFLTPVVCDSLIRVKPRVLSVEEKSNGSQLVTIDTVLEIKGEAKPAFIAELLILVL